MSVSLSGDCRQKLSRTLSFLRYCAIGTALGTVLAACDAGGSQAMGGQPGPTEVSVIGIQASTVSSAVELPGRTIAAKVAEVRPQVSGIITERLFTEGGVVEAGQQLYQIDDASYRADLERAQAELQRAEASARVAQSRMKRYQDLVKSKAVSDQDYEDARAGYEQATANISVARAAITAAEINLRYTKVHAPISGQIGVSQVTAGALVTQNQAQALTRITQLDPIYVDMPQSSTEFWKLRDSMSGDKNPLVNLKIDGVGHRYEHQGQLQFGDVTVDESTGSVRLRAIFPNPDHKLLPGLFIKARVATGERSEVLVPQRATSRDANGRLQVWRVEADSTVQPVGITAEEEYEDQWVVLEGIAPGDTIVMQGHQKLQPGANVTTTAYRPKSPADNGESLAGQ